MEENNNPQPSNRPHNRNIRNKKRKQTKKELLIKSALYNSALQVQNERLWLVNQQQEEQIKKLTEKNYFLEQALTSERAQFAKTLESMEHHLRVTKSTLRSLRERQTEKNKLLEERGIKVEELEKKVSELDESLSYCHVALQAYNNLIQNLTAERQQLTTLANGLELGQLELQRKYEMEIGELNKKIQALELECQQQKAREAQLTEKYRRTTIIADNVIRLYHDIDDFSLIKKPFLVAATEGMKGVDASQAFNVPQSTISRARKRFKPSYLHVRMKASRFRAKGIVTSIIRDFWEEVCPVRSGSRRYIYKRIYKSDGTYKLNKKKRVPVHIQTITDADAFALFKLRYPHLKTSLTTFCKYKPYYVRHGRLPTKADLLEDCPHCDILKKLREKKKLLKEGDKLSEREEMLLKEKEKHQHMQSEQIKSYLKLKNQVLEGDKEVLAIHDFTKVQHNKTRYNILMISVLTYKQTGSTPKEGHAEWVYIDFVQKGSGGNQDYFYVRTCWEWVLGAKESLPEGVQCFGKSGVDVRALFRGKTIHLLSDGAGQHFKQKKTISFWIMLQRELGVKIVLHFFVSYHGHNVCDAHACHLKMRILRLIRKLGLSNFKGEDQLFHALGSIKNTITFILPVSSISRDGAPTLSVMLDKKLQGIRSFHCFVFDASSNKLSCHQLSSHRLDENPASKVISIPTNQEIESFTQSRQASATPVVPTLPASTLPTVSAPELNTLLMPPPMSREDIEEEESSKYAEGDEEGEDYFAWSQGDEGEEEEEEEISLEEVADDKVKGGDKEFVWSKPKETAPRRYNARRDGDGGFMHALVNVLGPRLLLEKELIESLCKLWKEDKLGDLDVKLICKASSLVTKNLLEEIVSENLPN